MKKKNIISIFIGLLALVTIGSIFFKNKTKIKLKMYSILRLKQPRFEHVS